ncbi:MAG: hypothetical protein NVSMB38_11490 [Ktedonobacteraceae bacterium]
MQQRPNQRMIESLRAQRSQRTQPALPGVTQPTVPIISSTMPRPGTTPVRRSRHGGRATLQLCLLGILLELLLLALYPLLVGTTHVGNAGQQVQHALPDLLPWLPSLYWTNAFPVLPQLLSNVSWLNILDRTTGNSASVLLAFFLLVIASGIVLLASRIGGRVILERLSPINNALLFWLVLLLTGVFGITMLFAPIGLTIFSQDMLVYGLYGHMVAIRHVNPYGVLPPAQDVLQVLVGVKSTTPYGPVWTDISVLLALVAKNSIANTILVFRSLGLFAHLINVALLWTILTRAKPETRLSATLLYAWNPLILLFSVTEMHQEVVLVCIVLAAMLFFQRNSPTIGWVFVLLMALVNFLWLPLLPLFFRLMLRQSRILRVGHRLLWWVGMFLISFVVIVLAYAPYWHAIGFTGILTQLQRTFLQDTPVNSLDAALLNLPIKSAWLSSPQSWSFFALSIAALFLLFGLWLADTLELVALFSGWLLLILAVLLPTYWPWYLIAPLVLALCSTNRRTFLLTTLLLMASLLSYYWLLTSTWTGQALVTIGLPLLIWGWMLFFSSTWQMTHAQEEKKPEETRSRFVGRSRPSWLSRPSRPGRGY